jgi:phosphoenolpyruvate synthase/pyruvate phosphate dikinase
VDTVLAGTKASRGTARGRVLVVRDLRPDEMESWISQFEAEDSILVTRMTDPDFLPLMQLAAGIVTEIGGRTCHAAIVAREMGKPAVINLEGAMFLLGGHEVTIDGSSGEVTVHV